MGLISPIAVFAGIAVVAGIAAIARLLVAFTKYRLGRGVDPAEGQLAIASPPQARKIARCFGGS